MKLTIGSLFFLLALTPALPEGPRDATVLLNNGEETVAATLGQRGVSSPFELSTRDSYPNCKGSSLCSNSQGFKDQCTAAYNKIENTVYVSGAGAASGTCSGNCGVFVQGSGCKATGQDLRDGYHAVRNDGCQACGSARGGYGGSGCIITINYVTGC